MSNHIDFKSLFREYPKEYNCDPVYIVLKRNPHIPLETVFKLKTQNLKSTMLWEVISSHPELTLEFIVKVFHDCLARNDKDTWQIWNWCEISSHPNITFHAILSTFHNPLFRYGRGEISIWSRWRWSHFSSNPNLTWENILMIHDDFLSSFELDSESDSQLDSESGFGAVIWPKLDWGHISRQKWITFEIVMSTAAGRYSLIWSKWNWHVLSEHPNMTKEMIMNYNRLPNANRSVEFDRLPDWRWEWIPQNPNLTLDDVLQICRMLENTPTRSDSRERPKKYLEMVAGNMSLTWNDLYSAFRDDNDLAPWYWCYVTSPDLLSWEEMLKFSHDHEFMRMIVESLSDHAENHMGCHIYWYPQNIIHWNELMQIYRDPILKELFWEYLEEFTRLYASDTITCRRAQFLLREFPNPNIWQRESLTVKFAFRIYRNPTAAPCSIEVNSLIWEIVSPNISYYAMITATVDGYFTDRDPSRDPDRDLRRFLNIARQLPLELLRILVKIARPIEEESIKDICRLNREYSILLM